MLIMLNIILRGCNGRMGRAVSAICRTHDDLAITAGIDTAGTNHYGYPVLTDLYDFPGTADVVIDFTSSEGLEELLDYCIRRRLPLVLATTGLNEAQQSLVRITSETVPVFQSGNMSLGINLLSALAAQAAALLGEDFNVEIIERHHNQKLDAPSGTAFMLYDAVAAALPYSAEPVYDRHDRRQTRNPHEIGLHAIRGGTIVGDHDVIFAGQDEVITLSHSSLSREVFAAGAVRAARFLAGRTPGLYSMKQLVAEILEH